MNFRRMKITPTVLIRSFLMLFTSVNLVAQDEPTDNKDDLIVFYTP